MENKELIALDLYDTCIHHPHKSSEFKNILRSWVSEKTIFELRNLLQTKPINIEDAWFDIPDAVISQINQYTQENIKSTILFPDTLSTLRYLKDKWYKLALISNLAQRYEEPLRNLIPNGTFDYEALSFNVWDVKPNPWIFEYVKNQSWIDFPNMVMIWDKVDIDVRWAQNVWIDAIQVDRRMKWENIKYEKDYIKISTLSDLLEIL